MEGVTTLTKLMCQDQAGVHLDASVFRPRAGQMGLALHVYDVVCQWHRGLT